MRVEGGELRVKEKGWSFEGRELGVEGRGLRTTKCLLAIRVSEVVDISGRVCSRYRLGAGYGL